MKSVESESARKKYFEHTTLVKNLLNNLFREKIDYREDTPEYQKKLLTVNFKGKKDQEEVVE